MVDLKNCNGDLLRHISNIIPRIHPGEIGEAEDIIHLSRIVEVDLEDPDYETQDIINRIRRVNPSVLISFSLPFDDASHQRAYALTEEGAEMIHLHMSDQDVEGDPDSITNALQRTHSYLVEKNVREKVTLVSSGGIAEAAHVPKSIILGADAVGLGLVYQIALGCKVCYGDHHSSDCQLRIQSQDVEWAVQRIANLVGSWRDQLLEVLGGMGLREVRRQRGEMGRAMFYNDLEAKIFGGRE
jgi:hypothetical protein